MLFRTIVAAVMILGCGCKQQKQLPPPAKSEAVSESLVQKADTTALEKLLIAKGLVDIQSIDSSIQVDLRYSDTSNFLHTDVYGLFSKAYLQPDVAAMLAKSQQTLQKTYSGFTLIVLDAVRPLSVQQQMWQLLKMPDSEKSKYVSNPKNGSIHNYGAAVDITIGHINGEPLDMGTPFDYFGKEAEPQHEAEMLRAGKLTQQQLDNRLILRQVMTGTGFRQLPTEWWHYNACSREEAKRKYTVIE